MSVPDPRSGLVLGPRTAPLSLMQSALTAPGALADARCLRLEFSSRGDRVPGRVVMPGRGGPHPLVVLEQGADNAMDSPGLDAAASWLDAGIAIASIDLPLHGGRASPKLSERLLQQLAGDSGSAPVLLEEFARQASSDLARLVDALTTLADVDPKRIGYAGFGLGGAIGAIFCALDPRPRAVALAHAELPPQALDPTRYIGAIAPRPLLMVDVKDAARESTAAAEALFAAAAQPKTRQWVDAPDDGQPHTAALDAMRAFLTAQLAS